MQGAKCWVTSRAVQFEICQNGNLVRNRHWHSLLSTTMQYSALFILQRSYDLHFSWYVAERSWKFLWELWSFIFSCSTLISYFVFLVLVSKNLIFIHVSGCILLKVCIDSPISHYQLKSISLEHKGSISFSSNKFKQYSKILLSEFCCINYWAQTWVLPAKIYKRYILMK